MKGCLANLFNIQAITEYSFTKTWQLEPKTGTLPPYFPHLSENTPAVVTLQQKVSGSNVA
uniref:Uncharacterized protein n=1 Tax=Anguilla anguilla TaxID=7936 RepID=A0A0E9WUX9_ANGAN